MSLVSFIILYYNYAIVLKCCSFVFSVLCFYIMCIKIKRFLVLIKFKNFLCQYMFSICNVFISFVELIYVYSMLMKFSVIFLFEYTPQCLLKQSFISHMQLLARTEILVILWYFQKVFLSVWISYLTFLLDIAIVQHNFLNIFSYSDNLMLVK